MSNRLIDKVKNAVFEEDETKAPAVVTHLVPDIPESQKPYHGIMPQMTATGVPVAGTGIYEKLKSKTDFDQTDVGKLIQNYLAPLAGVNMDEATRLKVAIQMAGHKDSLSPAAILAAFENLKNLLVTETTNFGTSEKSFNQRIEDDNKSLQKLADEIAQKQRDMATLADRIASEKTNLQNTKNEFVAAVQARTVELNQQQEHYATILKG